MGMVGDYSFRLRFDLPASRRINIDENEWSFGPVAGSLVTLRAGNGGAIREATRLSCRASGYRDEHAAKAAGEFVRDVLTVGFARSNVPADFGDRAARSFITAAGIDMLEAGSDRPAMQDHHGLLTFIAEPPPRFFDFNVRARVGLSGESVQNAVLAALAAHPELPPASRIAYDLYSASSTVDNADARFLLLMMAVETLVLQEPRPEAVRGLVERFLGLTSQTDLPAAEKDSLQSALRILFVESIGQAGRRLARTLTGRAYADLPPDRFFVACYELRSALVHGHVPRPEWERVGRICAPLERFVSDLITAPIIGF